jgi:CheY-like chemotaxis protein
MKVLTATNGSEAIEIIKNPALAIVLMDIMMPGDGRLRDDAGDPLGIRVPHACRSWR